VTLGAKADARNTATDTTAITIMQVLKEISYMAQNPASVAVTATLAAASTIRITGAAGITLDAVLGAAKPANVLQVGGNDGTNAYAVPLASGGTSVVTSGPTSTSAGSAAAVAVTTASGVILAANSARKECIITNIGTTVIYLGLGATPTAVNYHVALSGCTNAHDGTGSVYLSDIWKGVINAISSGASGLVATAELT
jgi:uncharacterized protein YdaL